MFCDGASGHTGWTMKHMVLCVLDPKPDNFVPPYFVPTYLWPRTLLCINNFFSGPIFFPVVSYFGQLQKLLNNSKAGWLPLYSIVLPIFPLFCVFFSLLSFLLFLCFIVRSTSQVYKCSRISLMASIPFCSLSGGNCPQSFL